MKNIVLTLVLVVLVGAAAFYGGMHYQKSLQPSLAGNESNRQFIGAGPNGQGGMQRIGNSQGTRPVSGEIISQDDNSITVKMQDGSTKIVILSDQTTINKSQEGSKEDLKTGERITAFGTENSDGSITAQNISLGGGMFRIMNGGTPPSEQ